MSAWDYAPWDNDSAADWYGELFDEIPLAKKVEETLNLNPEKYPDDIRAAAAILIMLGRTYIWPIDDIDRHLELAISQMEKVKIVFEDTPEFANAVGEEIALLKSRYANDKNAPILKQPSSWGNFWA